MSSVEGHVPDPGSSGGKGLDDGIIRATSWMKGEPDWMLDMRLESLRHFQKRPLPRWGGDLSEICFDDIVYCTKPGEGKIDDPERLPRAIEGTDGGPPGPPDTARGYRAGVNAQREAEIVFHRNQADLEALGVIFCDMDTALRDHPELVRTYFARTIPVNDNKFSALNTAVWSGGSFIYVPPGVEVDVPLQAYFRLDAGTMGQFERTLIIADEGSRIQCIEGCSAPVYTAHPLRSAVVEIVVKPSAHVTYITIQNWSGNVFNLVTKRARVEAEGHMRWIDGNIGSRLTMTYPAVWLMGPKARGEVLSVAYAGPGQHQDTGAKMVHAAPDTTSNIVTRSISKDGGRSSYRGLVRVEDDADGCGSDARCDALILDDESIFDAFPQTEIWNHDARISHGATVSKIDRGQLFYLMSRGLSEQQAVGTMVNGFIEPVTRTLPVEYAVEWSRLIELQMEASVG